MNLKFVRGLLLFVVACGASYYVGVRQAATVYPASNGELKLETRGDRFKKAKLWRR